MVAMLIHKLLMLILKVLQSPTAEAPVAQRLSTLRASRAVGLHPVGLKLMRGTRKAIKNTTEATLQILMVETTGTGS